MAGSKFKLFSRLPRESFRALSLIISLFPIINNTLLGLKSTSTNLVELFQMHNESRLVNFFKLRLPAAVSVLSGYGILAFRDPLGIRPLIHGVKLDEEFELTNENLGEIKMPNVNGFFLPDPRPDSTHLVDELCMKNCAAETTILGKARDLDVTPEDDG